MLTSVILDVVMLSGIMLSIIIQGVVMFSVFMPNGIMLRNSITTLFNYAECHFLFFVMLSAVMQNFIRLRFIILKDNILLALMPNYIILRAFIPCVNMI
jgi:hypothetical protein